MKIRLTRDIKGSQLINDLEEQYGSLSKLEKLYEKNMDDLQLYTDLEDWKYYAQHPDEILEDGKTIVSDELVIGDLELQLLQFIKTKKPESVNELTQMVDSDIRIIYPKVQELANHGVIDLVRGSQKNMVPTIKYDSWDVE